MKYKYYNIKYSIKHFKKKFNLNSCGILKFTYKICDFIPLKYFVKITFNSIVVYYKITYIHSYFPNTRTCSFNL